MEDFILKKLFLLKTCRQISLIIQLFQIFGFSFSLRLIAFPSPEETEWVLSNTLKFFIEVTKDLNTYFFMDSVMYNTVFIFVQKLCTIVDIGQFVLLSASPKTCFLDFSCVLGTKDISLSPFTSNIQLIKMHLIQIYPYVSKKTSSI